MKDTSSSVLLSTAYLPPISWMRAALPAGKVFIEACETYPKQTYRNRCRVITANGLISLSIPIKRVSGNNTQTRDIKIYNEEPWQREHWRTIDTTYRNSPFFLYYKDELQSFYERKYRFLLDFNMEVCNTLFKLMEIQKDINLTTEYIHHPEDMEDLRNAFSPKNTSELSNFAAYHQVFEERHGFVADLSIIDLLFNEGPGALSVLNSDQQPEI